MTKPKTPPICFDCPLLAVQARVTQFAGTHYYCQAHAQQNPDFGQSDDSYQYWRFVTEEDAT
jgi:hypothetical protein